MWLITFSIFHVCEKCVWWELGTQKLVYQQKNEANTLYQSNRSDRQTSLACSVLLPAIISYFVYYPETSLPLSSLSLLSFPPYLNMILPLYPTNLHCMVFSLPTKKICDKIKSYKSRNMIKLLLFSFFLFFFSFCLSFYAHYFIMYIMYLMQNLFLLMFHPCTLRGQFTKLSIAGKKKQKRERERDLANWLEHPWRIGKY